MQTLEKLTLLYILISVGGLTGKSSMSAPRQCKSMARTSGGSYNVTRGMYDSSATAHTDGIIISTQPRHWLSRPVKLYSVEISTGETQLIASGILSASPAFDSGKWGFDSVDIMTELNRTVFTNWREQQAISIEAHASLGHSSAKTNVLAFEVQDVNNFALDYYGPSMKVKISSGSEWAIYYTYGSDSISIGTSKVKIPIKDPNSLLRGFT